MELPIAVQPPTGDIAPIDGRGAGPSHATPRACNVNAQNLLRLLIVAVLTRQARSMPCITLASFCAAGACFWFAPISLLLDGKCGLSPDKFFEKWCDWIRWVLFPETAGFFKWTRRWESTVGFHWFAIPPMGISKYGHAILLFPWWSVNYLTLLIKSEKVPIIKNAFCK